MCLAGSPLVRLYIVPKMNNMSCQTFYRGGKKDLGLESQALCGGSLAPWRVFCVFRSTQVIMSQIVILTMENSSQGLVLPVTEMASAQQPCCGSWDASKRKGVVLQPVYFTAHIWPEGPLEGCL